MASGEATRTSVRRTASAASAARAAGARGLLLLAGLACLLCAFATTRATADVIHLRNGGKLEGTVQGEKDGYLLVETRFGTQKIKKSDVASVEKKKSVLDTYREKREALDEDDAASVFTLAEWCRSKRMVSESKELYERVVTLDPMHEGAQKALGNVLYEGEWMTPEARDERLHREEVATRRAEGLVEYEGKWITPEERAAREQGLVMYEGKWRSHDEIQEMKGYVRDSDGSWVHRDSIAARQEVKELEAKLGVELRLVDTEHFSIRSEFDAAHVDQLAKALEKGYATFHETFGLEKDLLQRHLLPMLEVSERPKFQLYLEHFAQAHQMSDAWLSVARQAVGTYHFEPPLIADFRADRPLEQLVNSAVNKLGRILANLYYNNFNYLPAWYEEGIAVWLEVSVCGNCTTYYLGSPGTSARSRYKQPTPDVSDRFDPSRGWILQGEWVARLRDAVEEGKDTPMARLLTMQATELGSLDVAKCWSFVKWLVDRDPSQFSVFVREIRRNLPRYESSLTPRELSEIQSKAFQTAFDERLLELEATWKVEALGARTK